MTTNKLPLMAVVDAAFKSSLLVAIGRDAMESKSSGVITYAITDVIAA